MRIPEKRWVCAQGRRACSRIHIREAPATPIGSVSEVGTRPSPRSRARATGKAVKTATTTIFEAMVKPIQMTMRGATATRGTVWETTRIGMATWVRRGHSEVVNAMTMPTAIPAIIPAIPSTPVAQAAALSEGQLAAAEARIVVGAGRIRCERPEAWWASCHTTTTTLRETHAHAARVALSRTRAATGVGLFEEVIAHHVCSGQRGGRGCPGRIFEESLHEQIVDVALPASRVAVADASGGVLPVL